MTTGSLTPALALAYLRELSIDIRAALVLDAAGAPLAGEQALVPAARELFDDAAGDERVTRSADGVLVAVRAPNGLAVVATAGAFALVPLLLHDLRTVLDDLSGAP